jgi:predicted nucleotidyltransferase
MDWTSSALTRAGIASEDAALLRRVCERLLRAGQDVCAIVLFGSTARGEPHRDVDLLVVMGQGDLGREERRRALVDLRAALGLDAVGVDVALVSAAGLRWGLEAHYP